MQRSFITALSFIAMLGYAGSALAQAPAVQDDNAPVSLIQNMQDLGLHCEVGLDLGSLQGYTRYQRGGLFVDAFGATRQYPSPLSELKFPLDVYMLGLTTALQYKDRLNLNFELKKNLSTDAGSMEDSDWGYWYLVYEDGAPLVHDPRPNSLDIYSESKASLDAWVLDAKASYALLLKSGWSIGAGLGLLYQYFDYDVSDTTQRYPSYAYYFGGAAAADSYNGKIITYEVSYAIPYLLVEAGVDVATGITVRVDIGYSPYALGHDRDHHLIGITGSGSISETDYTGRALRYGLQCRGDLSDHWALGVRYEYLKITGDGDSYNYSGDGSAYTGKIDQDIASVQEYLSVNLRYCF
ncbi:MAG: omptin family outer membrane protease [Syntrophaceae bacterium]